MKNVFICPDCQKTYAAEADTADAPHCPVCSRRLLATNKTRADWDAMSREERLALLGKAPEKPQTSSPFTPPAPPRSPSVVDFVSRYTPGVSAAWKALLVLFFVSLFLVLSALPSTSDLLYPSLYMAGGVLVLLTDLYLACCFGKVAILKGHYESMYVWIPFIFTFVGYLLVVALPDRANSQPTDRE